MYSNIHRFTMTDSDQKVFTRVTHLSLTWVCHSACSSVLRSQETETISVREEDVVLITLKKTQKQQSQSYICSITCCALNISLSLSSPSVEAAGAAAAGRTAAAAVLAFPSPCLHPPSPTLDQVSFASCIVTVNSQLFLIADMK